MNQAQTVHVPTEVLKLEAKGDYSGIVKMYRMVQEQVPKTERMDHKAICFNIGSAYSKMLDYVNAEKLYTEAAELDPEDLYMKYMLGIIQLHNGKLIEGFHNYGYRWHSAEMQDYGYALRGKSVQYVDSWNYMRDKRVFVSGEQGLGDELMFSRAIVELIKVAKDVVKLSPESLVEFFHHNCVGANFSNKKLSEMPPGFIAGNYDCIVSVGDLFRCYVLEHGALPPVPLYTASNPAHTSSRKPKIGFVYSPGTMGDSNKERTINPRLFRQFERDCSFYSFQVGAPAMLGEDMSPAIQSFMDTADLLDGMDCAVTCDTAFAHLALNMDKPTLVIYDKYVDWRFKIGLYPKAQLLSTNDWAFDQKFENFVKPFQKAAQ